MDKDSLVTSGRKKEEMKSEYGRKFGRQHGGKTK
jgi:hypothetical protein